MCEKVTNIRKKERETNITIIIFIINIYDCSNYLDFRHLSPSLVGNCAEKWCARTHTHTHTHDIFIIFFRN